ncbi:unnamed protein product [Caenorhabditis brenneri]
MKNWANFSKGLLKIHEKLIEKRIKENNQNFTCVYTEIIGGDELSNGTILVESSKNEIPIEPGIPTEIQMEQFVIFCREPSGNHFYNKTIFNFYPKLKAFSPPKSEQSNGLMVFSISRMSHNQAMRHLKQFLTLSSQNDFISFSMFNQITNDNWKNSMKSFGENIWKRAKQVNNCPTFLHTDSPEFSRNYGSQFDYHPNLYNYFNRQYLGQVDNCISDGSVTVEDSVSLWTNFSKVFQHHSCHFSLLHLTEIATPEDGKIVNLDEILRISLEELLQNEVLINTTIVILSDGGTENKLITNRDVNETLQTLISTWNESVFPNFTNSLFHEIKNRNCEESKIPNEYCICSRIEIIGEEEKSKIVEQLLKIVKKEVAVVKCLSKVEINTNELEFRRYGSIAFFRFGGIMTTQRVKISETEGFSNSTQLRFHGKARFSNNDYSSLELREPLKLEAASRNRASDRKIDHCYQIIIKEMKIN